MEEKNMTALISCFARCYHYKNNKFRIFSDNLSEKILSEDEYLNISNHMSSGIHFFNPNFVGTKEEALDWILNKQLSPSVLGRSIFCEKSLENAIKFGCKEYLIYASGYDTFAYRKNINHLKVFEIDKSDMIIDKRKRLKRSNIDDSNVHFISCDFTTLNWIQSVINSNYNQNEISFSSLLGISYYLTKDEFKNFISNISNIVCDGSSIVFDYPTYEDSKETKMNEQLANAALEEMKSKYSYQDIENILSENGFLIYEHLNDKEMTELYFDDYNTLRPNNKIIAPKGVCYCLAVKKRYL